MSDLDAVGQRDNWICWICDEPVDAEGSVNNDRGPLASSWLVDRLSRFAPDSEFKVDIIQGGGQYVLMLKAN